MLPSEERTYGNDGGRILHFRPALFFAVFLSLGVLFAYLFSLENVSPWWLLCVGVPLLVAVLLCKDKFAACQRLLFVGIAFLWGSVAFGLQIAAYTDCPTFDGEYAVAGRVWQKERGETQDEIVLTDISVNGKAYRGKMTVYLPRAAADALAFSDEVQCTAYVKTTANVTGTYGLRAERIADGLRFTAQNVRDWKVTGNRFSLGAFLRQTITETVRGNMDETPAAVTLALLLGDTSGIETGLLENVRKGGIAHVFAVSGLHVGALFAFCLALVEKTKLQILPKWARFVLLTATLLLYGSVCGFSASVIRAVVTCLTFYAHRLVGWKADRLETLGLAAIAVLACFPCLLFATGFQLSFLACLGIVLLSRRISDGIFALCNVFARKEKSLKDPLKADVSPPTLWEKTKIAFVGTASVTLSAGLATAPALLHSFGYVSVAGVLLNLLFVPLVSALFGGLLALVVLSCAFAPIAGVLLYVPNVVVSALLLPFETLSFVGSLSGLTFGAETAIAYFAALFVCSDKLNLTKTQRLVLAILLFGGALFAFIAGNVR